MSTKKRRSQLSAMFHSQIGGTVIKTTVVQCVLLHNAIVCEVHAICKNTIYQFIQCDLENEGSGQYVLVKLKCIKMNTNEIVLMNVSTDWIQRESLLIREVKQDENEDMGLGMSNQDTNKTE